MNLMHWGIDAAMKAVLWAALGILFSLCAGCESPAAPATPSATSYIAPIAVEAAIAATRQPLPSEEDRWAKMQEELDGVKTAQQSLSQQLTAMRATQDDLALAVRDSLAALSKCLDAKTKVEPEKGRQAEAAKTPATLPPMKLPTSQYPLATPMPASAPDWPTHGATLQGGYAVPSTVRYTYRVPPTYYYSTPPVSSYGGYPTQYPRGYRSYSISSCGGLVGGT